MVNCATEAEAGVQSNEGYYFQTDKSLASQKQRDDKSRNSNGNPIKFPAKVLCQCWLEGEFGLFGLSNGTVNIVNLSLWKPFGKIDQHSEGPISSIVFSPKFSLLACGSWDKKIRIYLYNRQSGAFTLKKIIHNVHKDYVQSLCFLEEKGLLVSGCFSGMLYVWDVEADFSLVKAIQLHKRAINAIVSSEEGIFTASSDNSVKKLAFDFEQQASCTSFLSNVICLAVSSSSGKLYAGSADKRLLEIDITTFREEQLIETDSWITSLEVYPDGIYIGCENGNVIWYSHKNSDATDLIVGHFDRISALKRFNGVLMSSSLDGTIRKWNDSRAKETLLSAEEEAELEALGN